MKNGEFMKRILIGYIIDGKTGGIDHYLMNVLEQIALYGRDLQIDFLTNRITPQLKNNISGYKSNVYEVATLKHPIKQLKQTLHVIKKNKYDITYFNISTALNCIGAISAKICGVRKRIIHSHASGIDEENKIYRAFLNFFNAIGRVFLYRQGTDFCACSVIAGRWIFPKKIVTGSDFKVIKNTVDIDKFVFSSSKRKIIREKLALGDRFVIGHVGSFTYSKNHDFLLKIFKEVHSINPKALLMLIGEGILADEISRKISRLNLDYSVMLMGKRNDVSDLMQAMDVFVLPSNFEGFGIVGIEAQISGLFCVFSNRLPREIDFTNNCSFLEINKDKYISAWSKEILKAENINRRLDTAELAEKSGYGIKKQDISFLVKEEV